MMDPAAGAEARIACEIDAITGEPPAHEPDSARLPSGGVADFQVPGATLGSPGRDLIIEVKSMHDVTAHARPWLLDYVLHHPDAPEHWPPRSWSPAGERRIEALGFEASNLTSLEALKNFISIERLRGVAGRGGQLFRLSTEANQIAMMILFGWSASFRPELRWPARAVGTPFPGVISEPLDAVAVAFYPGTGGRPGVGGDIRAGLARKFDGYCGTDACLAIVVSDADTEDSWAALLDGAMGYPVDGSEPVLQVNSPFAVSGITLAVCASERSARTAWSYLTAGKVEFVENFDQICRAALMCPTQPADGREI
jgi:hypothetical protein